MRLLSHSARLPHHLVTLGVLYGQDLRFDINRLTVSTSVASSYWKCNASASLARFPCKLDLMPVRYGVLQRTSAGLGRHCFASDNRFQPVLLCGLFAAPSGFHNSILFFSNSKTLDLQTAASNHPECQRRHTLSLQLLFRTQGSYPLLSRSRLAVLLERSRGQLDHRHTRRTFAHASEELCANQGTVGESSKTLQLRCRFRMQRRNCHAAAQRLATFFKKKK
jgi:hypothetical protein